jgi:hypothetical protein
MSLTPLLNSETLTIDNHHAGGPIDIDDSGLHIHKRFNKNAKRRGSIDVIIPLDGREPVVRKDKKKQNSDDEYIISEINRAFKNEKIRAGFALSLQEKLKNIAKNKEEYKDISDSSGLSQEGKQRINEIIIGVVRHFGLNEEDLKNVLYEQDRVIHKYVKKCRPRKKNITGNVHLNDVRTRRNMYKTLYIEANLVDMSFTLTRAKYMLNLVE